MLNRQWFHKRYAIEQFQEEANGELPGTRTRVSALWRIVKGATEWRTTAPLPFPCIRSEMPKEVPSSRSPLRIGMM
jgi:hypothetical protein